mmetsp:Transcript_24957/g.39193  ORF Transcript_24957/g.39193 Transcript_24957/m.39193 type:complete len:83 (+) Transcript_24957:350-598(+)
MPAFDFGCIPLIFFGIFLCLVYHFLHLLFGQASILSSDCNTFGALRGKIFGCNFQQTVRIDLECDFYLDFTPWCGRQIRHVE